MPTLEDGDPSLTDDEEARALLHGFNLGIGRSKDKRRVAHSWLLELSRRRLKLGLFVPGPIGARLACEPAARALVGALGWTLGPSSALRSGYARLGA